MKRSVKNHARAKGLVALWTALSGAYFLWEALNYRGVFARLAELQINKFGAYAPFVTYLLLVGCAVLPLLVLAWLLRPTEEHSAEMLGPVAAKLAEAKRLRAVVVTLGGIAGTIAAAFLVFSMFFLPVQAGKLRTLAVSEIGSVPVIEGPTRLVGGDIGTIVYFGHDWFVSDERMAFAPYRPAAGGDGVTRVFVELDATDRTALAAVTQRPAWSGILVEGGLPGTARSLFNSLGVGISQPYYTLYRSEYALRVGYWLQAVQWLMLGLFLGLIALVQTRHIKQLERQI